MTRHVAASVLVPTTGDRGPLLPYAVGSALRQTIEDIEVLIVGDGVDPSTQQVAEDLAAQDQRVRFFGFPKGVRRGEPNRDLVLREHARGEIVCYLTDRDLYLPDHVAEMRRVLGDADFGHTLRVEVMPTGELRHRRYVDLRQPADRARHHDVDMLLPLSMGAHTMDAYRRLPRGWSPTPTGRWTDRWMWQQFLDEPWCTVDSSPVPTVVYLKRGDHESGWSTSRRLELLQDWSFRLGQPGAIEEFTRAAHDAVLTDYARVARERDRLQPVTVRRRAGKLVRRVLPPEASGRVLRLARRVLPPPDSTDGR